MRRAPKTPRGAGLRKDIGEGRQGSSEDREPADEGHFPGGFEKQTLTWLNGRDAPHHQEHVYTEGGGLSEQRPASRAPPPRHCERHTKNHDELLHERAPTVQM